MNWHHSRVYLGAQVAGRSLFARSVNAFLRGLNEASAFRLWQFGSARRSFR